MSGNIVAVINTKIEEKQQDALNRFHQVRKFLNKNAGLLTGIHTVLTIGLVVLLVIILSTHNGVFQKETTQNATIIKEEPSENPTKSSISERVQGEITEDTVNSSTSEPIPDWSTLPGKFKVVSRLEWLAQPPVERPTPLPTPVQYVIIHHTATENCSTHAQCILHLNYIQTFHMESKNWWDIGYNFLVGGDGEAYEGRGWISEGAHAYGYNSRSIGIAFIGTFNKLKPPQRQINACKLLIQRGVELGYVREDYKLLAVRQLQNTQSPGAALFEDMKTWDHWASKP